MLPYSSPANGTPTRQWVRAGFAALLACALMSSATLPAAPARHGRAAPTHAPPAAPASWVSRITIGPGGSHIIGNPAAPIRLAEWGSYTCSHCMHFAAEADPVLVRDYIATGRVSFEIRHLVRDPVDLAMAVAANCGASSGFVRRHDALMAAQPAIIARVQALPQSTTDVWNSGTPTARIAHVANDSGVTAWMRSHGLSVAQSNACLTSVGLQQQLVAMTNQAVDAGVTGTPTFAINGTIVADVHSWDRLRPAIDAAIAALPHR